MQTVYLEEPCRSALNPVTGMDFEWSLNPYTGCAHRCTFCYVRAFERRAERPSDDRYGRAVRVKVNVAEVLELELSRPSWKRQHVAVGAATDPYQPAEGRYRLTRSCLAAFARHRTPFTIITRGPMILRDVDVLQEAAARAEVEVHFSIPTLDPEIWRRTEPGTAPPRQRLRVLRALPGISDRPELMADVREHFLENLARDWPEELARYQKLYARSAYLPRERYDELRRTMTDLKRHHPAGARSTPFPVPPPEPEQLGFAI